MNVIDRTTVATQNKPDIVGERRGEKYNQCLTAHTGLNVSLKENVNNYCAVVWDMGELVIYQPNREE